MSQNYLIKNLLNIKDKNISEKNIADSFNISHNSVNKIVNNTFKTYLPCFNYLPDALCFDEFKATKDCDGYMSFIFCDAKNGKISINRFYLIQLINRSFNKVRI